MSGTPTVLVTGMVPPGPSGMRDYGDLVAGELRTGGWKAEAIWAINDERDLRSGLRATARLLRLARRVPRSSVVVWNYAPVSIGYRGLPGPAVLAGLLMRLRRVRVLVVFHELAQPWPRDADWPGRVRTAMQLLLLPPVVLGASAVVVTTELRRRRMAPVLRLLRVPLRFVPVFSNFAPPAQTPPPDHDGFVVSVLDYGALFARPDVVLGALEVLGRSGPAELVLVGSPGPDSDAGRRWVRLAHEMGLAERLTFTGILPYEGFTARLLASDVILLPNAQGPSPRKGTLAAALSHGRPVVSLDGPLRWQRLVDDGALQVAGDAAALSVVLDDLRRSRDRRTTMGEQAGSFYREAMSLELATNEIAGLLSTVPSR